MGRLSDASAEHKAAVCAALTDVERGHLARMLKRVADHQGLTPGVHPGFAHLGEDHDCEAD